MHLKKSQLPESHPSDELWNTLEKKPEAKYKALWVKHGVGE